MIKFFSRLLAPIFYVVGFLLLFFSTTGFIGPYLISAPNTMLLAFGVIYIVMSVVFMVIFSRLAYTSILNLFKEGLKDD